MFIHIACIAVGADVDISYWLLNLKMLNKFLHPSFAVLCEWSFAAGLDLFMWITNLCRSCFSTFCVPVGPAFPVSEFDRVDGLGFAFDVFCVTLLFLASQSLFLLNCWHCQELLYYFFDWRWIKINPKRLRIKMYSFLKAFLVLMKLLSLSQFYAPKCYNFFIEVSFSNMILILQLSIGLSNTSQWHHHSISLFQWSNR